MRPFVYARAEAPEEAFAGTEGGHPAFLAGGTTLLDLMKLDVMRPDRVVDINDLAQEYGAIRIDDRGLELGALVRMSEAAEHPDIVAGYPVIAQSLQLAASTQLRNMATLGGNVLQRTRCAYFRDTSWAACNKRVPGSGCAAMDGVNRKHAVLGTSNACIATYPGDFAQALIALDATVDVAGPAGRRALPFAELHRAPGDSPEVETALGPHDLITGFRVPALPWARRSLYLKVRDRESYDFALASAAVAVDVEDGLVREARIALGGVATKPWRARQAEAALKGRTLDENAAETAASAAFADAETRDGNAYKPELGRRTLVRALLQAATMRV
ncbi:MAG: FAD-binding molybdopterin dehydrogenase [Rhodospirillaceae bacterium]|nr:FAD-binding molybdopterin dehydrogenase [Rhodospirillaceae bacterium]